MAGASFWDSFFTRLQKEQEIIDKQGQKSVHRLPCQTNQTRSAQSPENTATDIIDECGG
jgi:hypothetical protein